MNTPYEYFMLNFLLYTNGNKTKTIGIIKIFLKSIDMEENSL
ncbi:hypothetical protein Clocl_0512 [Acetivibrio clariflavus DSM 19732]|uniref:Uncharacterized protein n=1 Tax=Acetivibrio clariflavus (strain DSM 19732 / NBRC 101661 / EBR45) TaxID=720554 RepID=G8LT25_ACECE|nr:hypothetical protein Clocl_0512 [Acetivibrio clariflavus DSM 19732]